MSKFKPITIQAWIREDQIELEHPVVETRMPTSLLGYHEAKVILEVPISKLKVIAVGSRCHLANDEDQRVEYHTFRRVVERLKTVYTSNLCWELYPGQPVWEFEGKQEDIESYIIKIFANIEIIKD